jgi:hypothetical protein
MESSPEIKNLAAALCKAQAQLKKAIKNNENPHFRSKFADLESVWDACREVLSVNGLSVAQIVWTLPEGQHCLTTRLLHSSGEYLSGDVTLPLQKGNPQELGSAIKYMRRYSLAALVGIVDGEDDDAELAEGRRRDDAKPLPKKESAPMLPPDSITQSSDAPGEYVVKFGKKYFGKKLKELGSDELRGYIAYLSASAKETGKGHSPKVEEFMAYANQFLNIVPMTETPPEWVNEEIPF